jgi:hypothetical protein
MFDVDGFLVNWSTGVGFGLMARGLRTGGKTFPRISTGCPSFRKRLKRPITAFRERPIMSAITDEELPSAQSFTIRSSSVVVQFI